MTRRALVAAVALAVVAIAAHPAPLAGEESRDTRLGELVGSVDALLRAALGTTDAAPRWVSARPVEPLVEDAVPSAARIVVRGVSVDGTARWIAFDLSEIVLALTDPAFTGGRDDETTPDEDRAAWDRRARAVASPRRPEGDCDPLRPPELGDDGAAALGAWVAARRGTLAHADGIVRERGGSTAGVAGPVPDAFVTAARFDLAWWLSASAVRRFASGVGTRDEAVDALRRIRAVDAPRPTPADDLLARLEFRAADDGPSSPLRAALADGDWRRPSLNLSDHAGFSADSPPPAGRLIRAAATVRWDAVPELVALVGDATASRTVTGVSVVHSRTRRLTVVHTIGELAEDLLAEVTRGARRPCVIDPRDDFRTQRAKAAADAAAWWREVQHVGIDAHLRSLAALGRPEAAEDLVELTGEIDAATLRAGIVAATGSDRWRYHRLAARCADREAARAVLAAWEPHRDHALERMGAHAAVEGGPGAARLRAAWQAATAPAEVERRPDAAAAILEGALLSGVDALGDWDEVVARLTPAARARVVAQLPAPERVPSAAARETTLRALAACLLDERDVDSPAWLDGPTMPGTRAGVGHGSRLCDLAAARLGGVVAQFDRFHARQPKAVRDAAIAAARREWLPTLDAALARPSLVGAHVGSDGAAIWDGDGPAPDTAWATACAKAAEDPRALPSLIEALVTGPAERRGNAFGAWVFAEWTTAGPNAPASFRCSVQGNGSGAPVRMSVVAELADGSSVARSAGAVDPTPGSPTWSAEAGRVARQLAAQRARPGASSLRVTLRLRP